MNPLHRILRRPRRAGRDPLGRIHLYGHHYTIGVNEPSTPPPSETDEGNAEPLSIEALISQPEDSPEIPETPAAAADNMPHEEGNSDDGIVHFHFC
jgi:hypothetical protein